MNYADLKLKSIEQEMLYHDISIEDINTSKFESNLGNNASSELLNHESGNDQS